ncbi:hypothetical protein BOX15_Mlig013809g3 [Macrostomum lignano]|uniref:Uncharacterized protein n=2 Tax=Macrostomum lignano TaxID=282301 RepID=A0A267H2G2_9PLAT|nr:hypothetical protein BOX15_Mlig013809g3 [Macrostomum lignano]
MIPGFMPRRSVGTMESRYESSEIISESEEFEAVRTLEQEAFTLLEAGQSQEALIRLSDALEIDAGNSRLLCLRAQLYCQLGDFETALSDAEQAASVEQFSCETCCFRSAILRKLERNDEAILHNIRCLSLDDCNLPRVKTSLLLSFRRMLPHTAEQLDAMRDLEIFNFLCQIGVLASKEGRQHLAIQLLEVAQTYETEQLGLRMLMLLSLANSYASRKYSEVAIELYTECLKVATEVHDSSYQIKCLVSLATMHLHSDNVAKATAYYQRLLDLRQDKAVINGDDWSPELECGLLLNLSICCATLGNLDESKRYAELSVSAAEQSVAAAQMQAQCRSNFGLALLRAGQPELAKSSLEEALKHARKVGDPSLLASCQGLLGSVMAELRNAGLSAAYHEQQIINSRRCDDRDALARAHLASGDSLRLLGKFDSAVDSFAEAGRAAIRPEMKLLAEVKIGETHLSADRPQRALYHFERCLEIAEADSAVSSDQLQSVQLQVAVIHQMSSSPEALDIAERLFYQLLPNLERGLDRPRPWDAPAPRDLLRDLRRCYLGLANSAAKRGKFERALLASEAARQRSLSHHLAGRQSLLSSDRFDGLGGGGGGGGLSLIDDHRGKERVRLRLNWDMDRLRRTVDLQSTIVLCLSLTTDGCLVWLLEPGRGLTAVDHRTSSKGFSGRRLKLLTAQLYDRWVDRQRLRYFAEGRRLPESRGRLKCQRRRYEALSTAHRRAEAERLFDEAEAAAKKDESGSECSPLEPLHQLYRMLLGGGTIHERLQSLPPDTAVTIVTDDHELASLPFELAPVFDALSAPLFRASSLWHLDCAINSELDRLRVDEDVEFERQLVRRGGNTSPRLVNQLTMLLPQDSERYKAADTDREKRGATVSFEPSMPDKKSKKDSKKTVGVKKVSIATPGVNFADPGDSGGREEANFEVEKAPSLNPRQLSNPHLLRVSSSKAGAAVAVSSPTKQPTSSSLQPQVGSRRPQAPDSGFEASSGIHFTQQARLKTRTRVADTVTVVTTRTATDTDVATSALFVTPFRQISDPEKCVVVGNPKLPKHLTVDGEPWTTVSQMQQAHAELLLVGEMCEVCPIEGEDATKDVFLRELQTATVMHIATYACLRRGYFALAPNPTRQRLNDGDVVASKSASATKSVSGDKSKTTKEVEADEASYLVKPSDLLQCGRLRAGLIVLSCGWATNSAPVPAAAAKPGGKTATAAQDSADDLAASKEEDSLLPNLLLSLGAQCVLCLAWPLPGKALAEFWRQFYLALQWGRASVGAAARSALREMAEIEEFAAPSVQGAIRLYGKDLVINLADIRSAQLSQTIDAVEAQDGARELLNDDSDKEKFPKEAALMYELQSLVSAVLQENKRHAGCLDQIASLLDGALKRLFLGNPGKAKRRLPDCLADFPAAVRLLRFLGFHFQPDFEDTPKQLIVFPHWDRDGLLLPAYHVFSSLLAVAPHPALTESLFQLLPTSQEKISYLVDLLAITKHAEELQVKQSDLTVRILLGQPKTLALVRQLGFVELGKFLYFSKTNERRALLNACLQLLIALSTHKSPSLVHKLDPELLGNKRAELAAGQQLPVRELSRLSTLEPLLLPRNQLRMATPWMTLMETADEMAEKMLLSRAHTDIERHVLAAVRRTRTWQLEGLKATAAVASAELQLQRAAARQHTIYSSSGAASSEVGQPSKPSIVDKPDTDEADKQGERDRLKVKVQPGGTPSSTRYPVDYRPPQTLPQVAEKRAKAHRVVEDRLREIGDRREAKLKELFLPYIHG